MKFHELDNSHVGSDTREKINIGLNRIVNVLTIPGNKVYFELAFQSESEVCSLLLATSQLVKHLCVNSHPR